MIGLETKPNRKLKMLPRSFYHDLRWNDPLRFYFFPILGNLYRRRVELCLSECRPGHRVLEIGFGSGATLPALDELYDEVHGLDLHARVDQISDAFAKIGIETHLRNGDVLELPYDDEYFDSIMLISILEHLRPHELSAAVGEIRRVLKPHGQLIYGVPVERKLLAFAFRVLGYNLREHHFSTEKQVAEAARQSLRQESVVAMEPFPLGAIYEVGHFTKSSRRAGEL